MLADPIRRGHGRVPAIAALLAVAIAGLSACGSDDGGRAAGGDPTRAVPPVNGPAGPGVRPIAAAARDAGAEPRPNIVVILTDDQPLSLYRRAFMPATKRLLEGEGTRFANGFALPPLCCPSRATLLTGQYPHSHGVLGNNPGYPALREPGNILAAWLHRAGYRTALIGKYLNGTRPALGFEPAPGGWDRWIESGGAPTYFGPELSVGGKPRRYPDDRYLTTVLTGEAVRFITDAAADGVPFFALVSHWAPHQKREPDPTYCGRGMVTAHPLPADARAARRVAFPRTPAFNERRIGDKPPRIRHLPRFSPRQQRLIARSWRCRGAALREVDRGVRRIYRALDRAGVLERTIIVFTSDNGFYFGEHRLPARKGSGFEAALHVPLVIRAGREVVPAAARSPVVRAPVGNVDLAPTVLDLAGVAPCLGPDRCRRLDGRSLAGLLAGERPAWSRDRALLNELGEGCKLLGMRTRRWSVIGHGRVAGDGRCRLRDDRALQVYDLRADPHQLENLARRLPGRRLARLRARVERLAACSGVRGREPRAPGFAFCE